MQRQVVAPELTRTVNKIKLAHCVHEKWQTVMNTKPMVWLDSSSVK